MPEAVAVARCPGCNQELAPGTFHIDESGITVYQCHKCEQVDELLTELIRKYARGEYEPV